MIAYLRKNGGFAPTYNYKGFNKVMEMQLSLQQNIGSAIGNFWEHTCSWHMHRGGLENTRY